MKANTFFKNILSFCFTALILTTFCLDAYSGETVTFYHTDILGSPVAASDESGQVVWKKGYLPFGKSDFDEQEGSLNRIGYTGHRDASEFSLVYMNARYYDPEVGRFLAIDPVGFIETNPTSFNSYAYANNNPYKYVDPDGRNAITKFIKQTIKHRGNVVQAAADVASDVYTLAGPSSTPFERLEAAISLVSPIDFSDIRMAKKWLGASNTVAKKELHRPYIRKDVRETVESRAPKTKDGRFRDPNTGKPIDGKYDLGHKRGSEFRTEKAKAEAEGLDQKQFNNRMNNPDKYQIEDPSSNRSHKFEQK